MDWISDFILVLLATWTSLTAVGSFLWSSSPMSQCVCVTKPIRYVPIDKILKNVMLCVSSFYVLPLIKMFRSKLSPAPGPGPSVFQKMVSFGSIFLLISAEFHHPTMNTAQSFLGFLNLDAWLMLTIVPLKFLSRTFRSLKPEVKNSRLLSDAECHIKDYFKNFREDGFYSNKYF